MVSAKFEVQYFITSTQQSPQTNVMQRITEVNWPLSANDTADTNMDIHNNHATQTTMNAYINSTGICHTASFLLVYFQQIVNCG